MVGKRIQTIFMKGFSYIIKQARKFYQQIKYIAKNGFMKLYGPSQNISVFPVLMLESAFAYTE